MLPFAVAMLLLGGLDLAWAGKGPTTPSLHFYFPRSGLLIALAVNSRTDTSADYLLNLAATVYQTLQKAGAVHAG